MQIKKLPVQWGPEATSAYWINRASRALLRLHESRLRPIGFGMSHLPVLMALEDGVARSQKELAERARIEQPSMTEMLTRMERDGVIEREPNPEDKRGSLVTLTRRSRARLPKAKAALLQGEDEAMASFTSDERALLLRLLQRVVTNIEVNPPTRNG